MTSKFLLLENFAVWNFAVWNQEKTAARFSFLLSYNSLRQRRWLLFQITQSSDHVRSPDSSSSRFLDNHSARSAFQFSTSLVRSNRDRELDLKNFWPAWSRLKQEVKNKSMLWTLFVILLVLWLLGVVSSYTLGGFIHILLVLALVALVFQLISGRRTVV